MADVAYTLCVSIGTREIGAALVAARDQLSDARQEYSPVTACCSVPVTSRQRLAHALQRRKTAVGRAHFQG